MTSGLRRLRPVAALVVAWMGLCPPADVRLQASEPVSHVPNSRTAGAEAVVPGLESSRQTVSIHRITSIAEVRTADLDADGNLDLVVAGRGGIRTWLNVGSGRFVEHAATRTILRRHSAPGYQARQRSTHTAPAALVADRQAILPYNRAVDRAVVCKMAGEVQTFQFASAVLVAGGSRAPPLAVQL
jgi:hypothetical protein